MVQHSIIISSYNRPNFIKQALDSVAAQTVADFEAIVADDGSNEDTLEVIRQAAAADERIRLLPCRDLNPDRTRGNCITRYASRINDALKVCAGEIIHYLADDDYYHLDRLKAFEDLFSNPKIMAGYGRLIYVNREGIPSGDRFPYGHWAPDGCKYPFNALDHNQIAHRKAVLEKVPEWPTKGRPDNCALDGYFFMDIAEFWPFMPIDRIVAYKRIHGLNLQWTQERSTTQRE
jgi:spore maturation protein CgeD